MVGGTGMVRRALTAFVAFAMILWSLPLAATPAVAGSSTIVIGEFRVRGPNGGNDEFIELYNLSSVAVNIGGWKVNGSNNAGTTSTRATIPAGVVLGPSCHYLLTNSATSGGPYSGAVSGDQTYGTGITDDGGIGLLNSSSVLVDAVGLSAGSAYKEGTTLASLGSTNADRGYERKPGPSLHTTDTDNNASDFALAAPSTPQNMSSPCGSGDVAPAVSSTTPANGATGVAVSANINVTFTEPVSTSGTWYQISCATSGVHSAVAAGGPTTFTLDPTSDFVTDENCNVTVLAANVTDQDTLDPPDNMASDFTFSFHTFIPPTAIHTIQGSTRNSGMAGSVVTTTGVVTAVKSNGFFIEAPDVDADADPNTSEGIFVFTGSSLPSAAVVGNLLQVTAKVQNFVPNSDPYSPAVTELSGTVSAAVLSTGNPLPTPITLTSANYDPAGGVDQLVKYEGMRVRIDDTLDVVSPSGESVNEPSATATTTGSFYATFPGVARPFREPGIERPEPNPPTVDPAETTATHIPTFDANPERVRIDASGLGANVLDISTGAQVADITGALDFIFRSYSIYLTQPATLIHDGISASTPVRLAQPYEFTVSSMNMERFFDTVNDPESDAVLTATALNNRVSKASLIVRNVLHLPDVVGVEEVEHQSTLKLVADKINADEVAAGHADPGYVAYLSEGNDVGGIDSGFLVKTSRVSVTSVIQYGKDTIFAFDGSKLNDRPPLVLTGTIQPPVGPAYPVLVIVNHLRSLSGINGNTTDAERIRLKRRAQAEDLANLIQGFQTADPNAHIVSVGDYNAFQFNDGYVDGINTIKGTPTPADQVTDASPDLVNPDLVDVIDSVAADQRYSFLFDGNAQEIDHVLINQNLTARFDELQYGRNNADFGAKYRNDPTRPERLSDHDPIVAYFSFPPQITAPADVTAEASLSGCAATVNPGTPSVFGRSTTITRDPSSSTFAFGTTTVTWTATDGGGTTATATQHVSVIDTTAPVISAPAPITRGTGPGSTTPTVLISDADLGSATASDLCDFTVSRSGVPSGNLFTIGTTVITYTATDASGNTSAATQTVTINDDTPPVLSTMADVVTFTGAGATTCAVVVSNATLGLATATDNSGLPVTITRSGVPAGNGFPVGTTTVTYTATDASGNTATVQQQVTVVDDTPPALTAPANVTRPATGVTTFVSDAVLGTATASDNCGAVTTTRTGVPAGNLFPQGTTTITYTATDGAGNTTTATQTVTLAPTSVSVCATVRGVVANGGEQNSLCTKLDAAAAAALRGNTKAHDNQIQAFINEVSAQRGKAISDADANTLIALAGAV